MGCAFIEGLQGDDPTYRKLDATIKHFAVHSGPESTRHEANVEIDRETMDDTYLWAFRYCIEHADPSAVMGAYNRVNGEPCCGSETLLKKILRMNGITAAMSYPTAVQSTISMQIIMSPLPRQKAPRWRSITAASSTAGQHSVHLDRQSKRG